MSSALGGKIIMRFLYIRMPVSAFWSNVRNICAEIIFRKAWRVVAPEVADADHFLSVAMITCEQIKGGRAMAGLSQKQLAKEAGVSMATLNNIERGAQTDPKASTIDAIRLALESRGIVFMNLHEGAGILLKCGWGEDAGVIVLIVDDNKEDRMLYRRWLEKAAPRKYRVVEAADALAGYNAVLRNHPRCILLDFKMQGTDGFQMLGEIKKDRVPLPPIIFVTGMRNDILKENAEKQGIRACLDKKTITKESLHEAVERALS
ncbi:MAG: response regulator [Alphaproteobacteria bacterium]|nr:response regulator [Alphaproteobacteria bacterium]